jgi:CRISPR-associated protein Cmr3
MTWRSIRVHLGENMPKQIYDIHALSPLLLRDGKPFDMAAGSETAAQSLPMPLPNTVAGLIRTQIGNSLGWDWSKHETTQNAHGICVYGPLLARDDELVFPAPRDAVVYRHTNAAEPAVMKLRPWSLPAGAGCDAPTDLQPLRITEDVKPESGYQYWKHADMMAWLADEHAAVPEKIAGLPTETRVHVGMDSATQSARDGVLFSVQYRAFEQVIPGESMHHWSLQVQTSWPNSAPANATMRPIGHLGGERRMVGLRLRPESHWKYPETLCKRVTGSKYLRLVLATPAIFEHGWKPGWLESASNAGLPPGLGKLKLKLRAAAVGRREPVSGWSMRDESPRAVRWMVPAGSVYFFEVLEGNPKDALESWLKSVSDNEQDRKDGFGLALWGVWNP